jgi:hypothetical protein
MRLLDLSAEPLLRVVGPKSQLARAYERTKLTTGEAGFAAAAAADSAVMQAALTSYAQMATLKVQLYGAPREPVSVCNRTSLSHG